MNKLDTMDNLEIGQLAMTYRMQLETKRMSEMMEVGRTYFSRELLDMMDCSLASIHVYGNELVKHNLVEKNIIQPKGYKQAVFKRLAGEYHTMDFQAKVSMIRNKRDKVVVMPELPSNLLLMMGYTEFKPPKGRHIKESMPDIPVSKPKYYVSGCTLEMA
jgi:hypothetical protein